MSELVAGFQTDCEELLARFQKENCVRFSTFCRIWQEMHFSLVYAGRPLRNLIVFTSDAFELVKKFMIETNIFALRVGALYILYGLYFKQPIEKIVRIHITLSDWTVMKLFINELRNNAHYDTLYIMLKLLISNAFQMAAFDTKFSHCLISKQIKKSKDAWINSSYEEGELEKHIKMLKEIEMNYSEAKSLVQEQLGKSNVPPFLSNNNLADVLAMIEGSDEEDHINASDDITPKIPVEDLIGASRKRLKEKCFSSVVDSKCSIKSEGSNRFSDSSDSSEND